MLFKHKILNGIWLMEQSTANSYLPVILRFIHGNPLPDTNARAIRREFCSLKTAGSSQPVHFEESEGNPHAFVGSARPDSILILSLTDAITKYDQSCGPAGMATCASLLQSAYLTDNIAGVVLKIDSGGGEGGAMRLMQDTIAKRNKPVVAFIDDFAASAAYGIASACDIVTANNELARIGSIGVYLSLVDYSEQLKKEGINLLEIYAPQSTDKNADVRGAFEGKPEAVEALRSTAGRFCESFIRGVENSRSGKLRKDRREWGTGKVYFAPEALEIGLIDSIDSFENFLNYLNIQ